MNSELVCICTSFHAPLLLGLWIKLPAPAPHPPESWNTPSSLCKIDSCFNIMEPLKTLGNEISSFANCSGHFETGRNRKYSQWSIHRMEKLRFLRNPPQKMLEFHEEILEEFPILNVYWCDDGQRERREDSHFVGHVKDQRGDWDEDQAHPEDPWTEHHFRLLYTQTHTYIDIGTYSQVTVQNISFNNWSDKKKNPSEEDLLIKSGHYRPVKCRIIKSTNDKGSLKQTFRLWK